METTKSPDLKPDEVTHTGPFTVDRTGLLAAQAYLKKHERPEDLKYNLFDVISRANRLYNELNGKTHRA